ncbi:DUF1573 domain-containing protein [Prevotella sp. A2931]|uniref:DUF1573 domain-containing protein n=1 Tax=Prevotella illustrans TaxID=2800387 RepID=A0ABS3M891_9BACT|nr:MULTISPECIES: DUF1573 domain-containing protein [Prevotella]MBO1364368.1 DUF1573 domain-containing protein [Prevotella illustrans]PTL26096.1 DUF1573 domain-containing protein [Prevotella sp. oral taxon 820]
MKKAILLSLLVVSSLSGVAQKLSVEKESINVGQVLYRNPVTVEFKLTNKGYKPLRIEKVRTSCGCTTVAYANETIAGGKEYILKATYDAATLGHFQKEIGLYINDRKRPLMLKIRGVVVDELKDYIGNYPYDLGDLKTDKNQIEFDDINRGDRPSVKIHIYNNGDQVAEPQVMHLPNYLTAEIAPSKIAPRHQGEVILTLDTKKLRDLGLSQTSVYLGFAPGEKVSSETELPVTAVLLPSFQNMTREELAQAPKLKLSTENLDLGEFHEKKKLKGMIEIFNAGQTTLEIRNLQMFTTGLEVALNKTKIAPRESAKLKIAATRDIRKVQRPRVLMITNDPEHPKVIININVK